MVERRMNSLVKWALIIFGLISVILNIVLIGIHSGRVPKCSALRVHPLKSEHDERSLVFADLTQEEYLQVQQYMLKQRDLDISTSQTTKPSDNFLFLIDLSLPKKSEAVAYLDGKGQKPIREATVVVFYGSKSFIKEYVVGPLPNPTYRRDVTKERYNMDLPINKRLVTIGEYNLMFKFFETEVFSKLAKLLKESFGVDNEKRLTAFEQMPRGLRSGDRKTWVSFFRDMSGMYIHPVGFEVLLNHESVNASQWKVEKLLYNGKYFNTVEELKMEYNNGKVKKIVYKESPDYGSLKPRKKPLQLPPQQFYSEGKRYSIGYNHVLYLDWSFAFGLSSLTGMRVFDVRFNGERIAYEISVQEAMSVYGSVTPGMILTKFLDSSIGIGRFAHELVRGVDCPYNADYVDTYRYIDVSVPVRFRNSICIFEHNMGQPLRRHFADFFHNSYGGMVNSALIFRTITAIGNYDYMWDFIFYQSGSVEAKVHATGYISSSYLVDGNLKYGHQVAENVLGNIHTHFINFKVDLDVAGVENVFQIKDMEFVNVSLPWMPDRHAMVPRLVEKQLQTEQEAAQRFDTKTPRYLHIASKKTNRWGHQRTYKLQVFSFAGDHLPENQVEERSMSWARYKVAITKQKDSEQTSSSLYNQNDIWTPAVDFSKYIEDNESIEDQDLVAWVTTGFLHIPHAEDIPNTVTVGNGGGVILRPHNYFDEDPSIHSTDSVYLSPGAEDSCENNRMACLAHETCSATLETFTYHGFDGVMKFED
ncbi:primary amine oxidase, liver isozyme-like [Girardinichthys multiradiatus]|uniref:primary amine oxidase, liver isozyme-like n=1 Tax=Girardinichthys multiradiatus TaxID=208333 RepID=UPI001FAE4C3C|nr:primary amine oxidase, liver isozyme-like [Girardinichthys multiradiatus]XP_047215615.1 primary amine oxidase, liver isozyme-like [Girardinichthys multiradiatus]